MAKYLVIVESPAKVKTIKKFLGSNYEVLASNGHVRDLPKSTLGVDIENDYEPKYVQIAENIKKLINSRIIKDGDKLPPIRELSKALKVNNVTVVNCYNKLVSEGYAYQKMGSGTFAKKREIVDYFKKEYSKEIKLIKNKYDSNIIDFTGESSRIVNFPINKFKIKAYLNLNL